ncbi:hypothetical protein KXD40_002133 [Peronospora effusa]|nr:hypothetical protein KXD40_002133 [Peronospora effusa]
MRLQNINTLQNKVDRVKDDATYNMDVAGEAHGERDAGRPAFVQAVSELRGRKTLELRCDVDYFELPYALVSILNYDVIYTSCTVAIRWIFRTLT